MLVSAVVEAVRQHFQRCDQRERDQTANNCEMEQAGLGHRITSSRGLEANVLQGFGGVPEQTGREHVVATPARKVALGDPRSCAVAGRGKLVESLLGGAERDLGLVEPILLEQCTAQDEVRVADLVEEVDAAVQKVERMARLLLRALRVAGPQ